MWRRAGEGREREARVMQSRWDPEQERRSRWEETNREEKEVREMEGDRLGQKRSRGNSDSLLSHPLASSGLTPHGDTAGEREEGRSRR